MGGLPGAPAGWWLTLVGVLGELQGRGQPNDSGKGNWAVNCGQVYTGKKHLLKVEALGVWFY